MPVFSTQRNGRKARETEAVVENVCDIRRSQRLFKRCDNPTLPNKHPLYSQAKRLEYDGDIAGALDFLYRAMMNGERVDSCLKDIAGLLNMMGRTAEAVEFLMAHSDKVSNWAGYTNLLCKLQAEIDREEASDLPRGITVTVLDRSLGSVSLGLCDRLFPNPAKIRRFLYTDEHGFVAAVHFASHSSARKALQVHKLCSDQVSCSWASLYTESRLKMLEKLEKSHAKTLSSESQCLPPHLVAFGGLDTIPVYREADEGLPPLPQEELDRLAEIARAKAETASMRSSPLIDCLTPSAISPASSSALDSLTTTSPISSPNESMILSALLTTQKQMCGENSACVEPYMIRVPGLAGGSVPAVVVPLDLPGVEQTTQIKAYADSLSIMAAAMARVSCIIERSHHAQDPFITPIKPRRNAAACALMTPSPVIDRYMFT